MGCYEERYANTCYSCSHKIRTDSKVTDDGTSFYFAAVFYLVVFGVDKLMLFVTLSCTEMYDTLGYSLLYYFFFAKFLETNLSFQIMCRMCRVFEFQDVSIS